MDTFRINIRIYLYAYFILFIGVHEPHALVSVVLLLVCLYTFGTIHYVPKAIAENKKAAPEKQKAAPESKKAAPEKQKAIAESKKAAPAPQSVLMCIALRKCLLTLRYTFSFFYSNVFY